MATQILNGRGARPEMAGAVAPVNMGVMSRRCEVPDFNQRNFLFDPDVNDAKYGFNESELAFLHCLVKKHSATDEVADHLSISPKTVRNMASSMYVRLDSRGVKAENRGDLISEAYTSGMIFVDTSASISPARQLRYQVIWPQVAKSLVDAPVRYAYDSGMNEAGPKFTPARLRFIACLVGKYSSAEDISRALDIEPKTAKNILSGMIQGLEYKFTDTWLGIKNKTDLVAEVFASGFVVPVFGGTTVHK